MVGAGGIQEDLDVKPWKVLHVLVFHTGHVLASPALFTSGSSIIHIFPLNLAREPFPQNIQLSLYEDL